LSESWRAVVGYEGAYEVSDLGRVRSLPGGLRQGKVLKPVSAGRGYLSVTPCIEGVARKIYVHHAVAAAFIGPRPDGLDVCHGNGDLLDNRPDNLRYDTVNGNMRDAIAHGNHRVAAKTMCYRGHEYAAENTELCITVSSDGYRKTKRVCKTCRRTWRATTYQRTKARSAA
jgi:hypothetical protein